MQRPGDWRLQDESLEKTPGRYSPWEEKHLLCVACSWGCLSCPTLSLASQLSEASVFYSRYTGLHIRIGRLPKHQMQEKPNASLTPKAALCKMGI